jgi:hypothetical protein
MPSNQNFNAKNMDTLIGLLAQKAGVSKDRLAADIAQGKLDSALANMTPDQKQKFNQITQNPGLVNMFLSNPQAKALYNKFMG